MSIHFFSDIEVNPKYDKISFSDVGKSIMSRNSINSRVIDKMSIVTLISGLNKKDGNSLNEKNVLDFNKKYEFAIRLTETITGQWKDLERFCVYPNELAVKEKLCMNTFNLFKITMPENIILTPKSDNECFVIKVLVREFIKNRTKDDGWIIQSINPIVLTEV